MFEKMYWQKVGWEKTTFYNPSLDFHSHAHSHDVIMFEVCRLPFQKHQTNFSVPSLMIPLSYDEIQNKSYMFSSSFDDHVAIRNWSDNTFSSQEK